MRDVVQAAVSEVTFRPFAWKLQRSRDIPLIGDPVRTVAVLGQRCSRAEHERTGVLWHLIEGAELSAYGLVNAATHSFKSWMTMIGQLSLRH